MGLVKAFPLHIAIALLTAAALHAESLLVPRIAGEWQDLARDSAVAKLIAAQEASTSFADGAESEVRDPFLVQIAGVWHCYYAASDDKTAAIFLRTSADRSQWSKRTMVASGGQAGTGADSARNPCVVEAEPGHYYLFRTHRDDAKTATSVYHSTDPMKFGLDGQNGDALHFVTTLPAAARRVVKQDGAWLIASDAKFAKLEWQPIPTPARAKTRAPGIHIRVALFDDRGSAGKGVPSVSEQLAKAGDIEVATLDGGGIRAGLSGYDVVARRFVEAGGGYVGICAGAYLACDGFSWGIKILDAKTPSPKWERGHADLKIETTGAGQSLLGLPRESVVLYHNGPVLVPAHNPAIPDFEPLVFFRSEISKSDDQAGLQINTPAIARGTFGAGRVLVSSPHPEQTPGMEGWIVRAVRSVAAP